MRSRGELSRLAWLAVVAAVATMVLKTVAYLVTDSIGLLSDALESGVNLASALLATMVLRLAAQPPDEEHAYGHEKAEYFSSAVEGALITVASATVTFVAVRRILEPQPLQLLNLGLGISLLAACVNWFVARMFLKIGREERSMTLEAGGQHLMTDVWTSVGVLMGLTAVAVTGLEVLDPLIGLVVAAHIFRTGFRLVRNSMLGLMDTALPAPELKSIEEALGKYASQGVRYHALRTRQAGAHCFVSAHIQVPGSWSVQRGHDLLEKIERDIRHIVPSSRVFTHLEPIEDPRSWEDQTLDHPVHRAGTPEGMAP